MAGGNMNIRQIAQRSPNYFEINEEERNYAAIFYAALCKPHNAKRFLDTCKVEAALGDNFGIYFEYAYLRDLWKHIDGQETKKEIIRRLLKIDGIDQIMEWPIVKINQHFGVAGQPSNKFVQYPGNWAITKFHENFSKDDFLKVCKFKWSFNIKPDIVIHLDKDRALCIEAKYRSGEGSYPSSSVDKDIFHARGCTDYVKQIDLQRYMMEELLGVETQFIYLVFKEEKSDHRVVKWKEAFDCLDLSEMPRFAVAMIEKISQSK
jgi:hypothetical protein